MHYISASVLLSESQRTFHAPDANVFGLSLCHYLHLVAANSNFAPNPRPQVIKRMSAVEAMALNKAKYKATLDYLS